MKEKDLEQFNGSQNFYVWNPLSPTYGASEGVIYVAENAGNGAFWLLDMIVANESYNSSIREQLNNDYSFARMHFWQLKVNISTQTATVSCLIDLDQPVWKKEIEYTDFPLSEIYICVGDDGEGTNKKLFLASEY